MSLASPLLVGVLVALSILIGFFALWRLVRVQDPVAARLKEYGTSPSESAKPGAAEAVVRKRRAWPAVSRLLAGLGLGPRLARSLTRADLPVTAAEFSLLIVGMGVVGYLLGAWRAGPLLGLLVGVLGASVPIFYLRRRQGRRLRALTSQLPDMLALLVGALRAGYGLSQAVGVLAEQMPAPTSVEFSRVLRAMSLGLSMQQALNDMAERVGSDDLDLVVTAINVQVEMGGNLAQTLETIGDTVRDRIRIKREVRVLTAQQRFTGYLLAGLPLFLGVVLFLISPDYMKNLFKPGWIRLLPITAVVMQVVGFLVIRRIVDIEV